MRSLILYGSVTMADISQVKLPNNNVYNFKDKTQSRSDHQHYDSDLIPLVHKKYESTSYYATTNDWLNATWYFMSVKPDSWLTPWRVKLKVHSYCPSYLSTGYDSYTWSTICGREGSIIYADWNEKYSSAHSYITVYPLKKAGFDSGLGHAFGISIYNAASPTNSAYYRTFEVDYYECENCTVTFLDTPVKWDSWTGYGSTNYGSLGSLDAITRGLQESGDANDGGYYVRRYYSDIKVGANKIFPYTMIMQNADGRWESLVTSSNVESSKTRNTHGFVLGQLLLMYANATYNENIALTSNQVWEFYGLLVDHRYSFNTENNATKGTTAAKPVYLVGSLGNDGLFYLDATWWTQTLPTTEDGKLYIYIGDAYDYYRMNFASYHPIYHYVNGMLREYIQDSGTVNGHTVQSDVPSNAVFTDTTYTLDHTGENVRLTPTGGTAQTVSLSNLINGLGEGTSPATANDYAVVQYAGGGTTNTIYYRRKLSNVVNKTIVDAALGKGSDTTKFYCNDGTWAVPTGNGDVTGSSSSTANDFASFSDATGKVIKDSGYTVSSGSTDTTATHMVLCNDSRLSNPRTPTSHTHGNIQNGGTLQTTDITIASGDKLVVTDSSDNNKVARTSVSFDGSDTSKALTPKGTFETFINDVSDKMDKIDPTGYGSLSINRKSNTTIGTNSVAVGNNNEASGLYSLAAGSANIASGTNSVALGHQCTTSLSRSFAMGESCTASGSCSQAEGAFTIAASEAQHVFGMSNVEDANKTYIEIVGNGADENNRSNARTLDWSGNEWIAGGFECSGMRASSSSVTLINPQKWRDAIFDATPEGSAKDRLLSRLYKEGANIRVLEYGGYFGGSQNKRLKITCPQSSYGKFLIFVHLEADTTVHDYEIFGVLNAEGTAYSKAHYGRTTPSWTNMVGTASTGTLTWGVTGTQIYSSIFAPYGSWYVKIIMSIGSNNDDIPNVYMTNES